MDIMNEAIEIPILPLPNVVLFPHTLLPLHIFEPRYRKMTADCLQANRQLGVVLVRRAYGEEAKKNKSGMAPTHKILCVGNIVDHQLLPEGQFNIKVEGIHRAELLEFLPSWPYRRAKVMPIKDVYDVADREELMESRARLERELTTLGEAAKRFAEMVERIMGQGQHPGILSDLVATHFVSDPYDRQSILSETDLIRRVDLTAIQMENLNRRVRRAQRKAT